jgi:DNA repair exonuclease SbcCD ATPase subunit
MKSKESEILTFNDEFISNKSKLESLENFLTPIQHENKNLKQRVSLLENELKLDKENLQVIQSKMEIIEPEYNILKKEKADWLKDRQNMSLEINKSKQCVRMMDNLQSELDSFKNVDYSDSINNKPSDYHYSWTRCTSIANINPILCSKIQQLFNDLQKKESEGEELESTLSATEQEILMLKTDSDKQHLKLSKSLELATKATESLNSKIHYYEKEMTANKKYSGKNKNNT